MSKKSVLTGMAGLLLMLGTGATRAADVPLPPVKPASLSEEDGGFLDRLDRFLSGDDEGAVPIPQKKPVFKKPKFSGSIRSLQKREVQRVLSRSDAEGYKEVFRAQKLGDMERANELLKHISNPLLLGHVLYQRYMHPDAYSSTADELERWLAHYADHPNAEKIHTLALKKGADQTDLRQPVASNGLGRSAEPTMRAAKTYQFGQSRAADEKRQISETRGAILKALRQGKTTDALSQLQSRAISTLFDKVEIDILTSEIAASLLYQGEVAQAFSLADAAASRSALYVPKASWVAGLVSWMHEDYGRAARYFEEAAKSSYASGWLVTAASYWAARAHMRTGNVTKVSDWLARGMEYPRTFYGLISTRALGKDFDFNWDLPPFTKDHHDRLSSLAAGARAIALAKVGQAQKAQAELLRTKPANSKMRTSFLAFAGYADLPALAMRLAGASRGPDDAYYDAALYPRIPWKPESGFEVDEAFMHAIMKQESRFNPDAESPSGAKGLMQIMPATARAVSSAKAEYMNDPPVNLELGQRYLKHLLKSDQVDGNLLYLLIAYNAGPGNLAKWRKRWPDVKDPLLFIELLPSAETRAYVERVLANYWIYRMREGQDISTMESIAAGRPAMYTNP